MGRYFSNGTEFYAWYENWCSRCVRDHWFNVPGHEHQGCPLLLKAFTEPDAIIPQWLEQDTSDGFSLGDNVHCIDFKPYGFRGGKEPTPKPPPPGQEHLFDPPSGPKLFVGELEQPVLTASQE